jgi:gas vesicle protein
MRQVFRFMMGIMVGALVGSTLALLLAPDSGVNFRNGLRARGDAMMDELRQAAETRRIEMTDRLESLRGSLKGNSPS